MAPEYSRIFATSNNPATEGWRYLLAVLLVLLAFALRLWIGYTGVGLPFLTFFPTITLAAIFGGVRPALLATVLAVVLANHDYIPFPEAHPGGFPVDRLWSTGLFILGDLVAIWAVDRMHEHIAGHREAAQLLTANEALLKSVIEGTTDAIYVKDANGRYRLCNSAAARQLGRPAAEVVGLYDRDLFPPDVADSVRKGDVQAMAEGHASTVEHFITFLDGRRAVFQSTIGPIFDPEGSTTGLFGISREVTEIKRAEEQLRLAARIFDRAAEGVVVTDAQNQVLTVNAAFTEVTGYTIDDMLGKNPSVLKSGRQPPEFYQNMWQQLNTKGWWQGEIWNRRKNGDIYLEWLSVNAVKDHSGKVLNYVGLLSDITLVRNSQQRIEYLATHDELTGLPNRTLVLDRLNLALARARRQQTQVSVLFVDLDNFKYVNDSLGHEQGDALLVQVARRLREALRTADTVARLGGDEFIVIIEATNDDETRLLAERILASVSGSYLLSEKDLFISASVGISCYPADGELPSELMKCADTAMYRAKAQGKNSYLFFTAEMADMASIRVDIEAGLREAISKGELFLEYQPQILLKDGSVIGAEALLRWRRGQDIIPPGNFIPVAEESSIIMELEEWAMKEACRQVQEWDAAGLPPCRLSVNISGRHFRNPGMASRLHRIVEEHAIRPGRLCIEITESVLANVDQAMDALSALRASGFSTSIDDFGTGFSSLSYLKRFPIEELKIDRSFTLGVASDTDDRAIVQAIIALAHSLGLTVVAEGVEDATQEEQLRAFGCDSVQGYLYARPLPPSDFARWLSTRSGNRQ